MTEGQAVTFIWPARGHRTGMVRLKWLAGKSVKQYLLEPVLRQYGVGALVSRCRIYNQKKQRVKMIYTPVSGDVVVFAQAR